LDVAEEILETMQMIMRNSEADWEKRSLERVAAFIQGKTL